MIVYNITMKIHPEIEAEWLEWQQGVHVPEVMATGCFSEYKFFKLLEQDEREGLTYVIQYFAHTKDDYTKYIEQFAPLMREKVLKKWGEKFFAFRTVMQTV